MAEQIKDSPENISGQSIRVLGLIGVGHALSSFYLLCLPPLIPFLKSEFQVSYTLLGTMLSARSISTGILQLPMGVLVDRFGGKHVLGGGMVIMTISFGLIALVPNLWWTLPLAALFGLGLATIRPSNYTILIASMPPNWIGRSFGINMFAGHLGRVLAPPLIVTAAVLWGWRSAVLIAGALGVVTCVGVLAQWRIIRADTVRMRNEDGPGLFSELRLLATWPLLLLFVFYLLQSFVTNGIHAFSVAALVDLHATPLTVASTALVGFLIASATGVLVGGFLVDMTPRHDIVASVALCWSAACLFALGTISLPAVVIVAAMIVIGLCEGTLRPARDMMVRSLLPQASFGKAIGMVATGASIGGAVSPIALGRIMDTGQTRWVFYVLAACVFLIVITVLVPKKGRCKTE